MFSYSMVCLHVLLQWFQATQNRKEKYITPSQQAIDFKSLDLKGFHFSARPFVRQRWWKCTVSLWQPAKWMQRCSLHKAPAQQEHSLLYVRGSPSIKLSPSLKGNIRRWWGLFLLSHTAIFYVQRNDWYTLGYSSGEMLKRHFYVNSPAWEEMVACFEPPRLL